MSFDNKAERQLRLPKRSPKRLHRRGGTRIKAEGLLRRMPVGGVTAAVGRGWPDSTRNGGRAGRGALRAVKFLSKNFRLRTWNCGIMPLPLGKGVQALTL